MQDETNREVRRQREEQTEKTIEIDRDMSKSEREFADESGGKNENSLHVTLNYSASRVSDLCGVCLRWALP
jgi:hypothetical protein